MYFIVLWISYVFLCFFDLLFLLFFPVKFVADTFLKHNNAKTNSFQPLRVKISIFIWTMWKNSICIDFVHKITFWSHFRSDVHGTKSYVTSEPYPRASQIWCQNVRETWKKKVRKCRGESFARCRVIARNVEGGGLLGPPPSLFRVNCQFHKYQVVEFKISNLLNKQLNLQWDDAFDYFFFYISYMYMYAEKLNKFNKFNKYNNIYSLYTFASLLSYICLHDCDQVHIFPNWYSLVESAQFANVKYAAKYSLYHTQYIFWLGVSGKTK